MMRPQAEWKGQGDDAQGNAQHTRDWSSRYHALATPPTRAAFIVQGSRMAGVCALLQLGDSACVLLRLGGLWPGLRGLAVRLPFIAFPAESPVRVLSLPAGPREAAQGFSFLLQG